MPYLRQKATYVFLYRLWFAAMPGLKALDRLSAALFMRNDRSGCASVMNV